MSDPRGTSVRVCARVDCMALARPSGRYCRGHHAEAMRAQREGRRRPIAVPTARCCALLLLRLLRAGQRREWASRDDLIRAAGASRATFYRRLGDLQRAGYPVEADGYRQVGGLVASDGRWRVLPCAVPRGTGLRIVAALNDGLALEAKPVDLDVVNAALSDDFDGLLSALALGTVDAAR